MRNSTEEKFYRAILRTEAIRFGIFKLSSGKLSPYYVDMRMSLSFPSAFSALVEALAGTISSSGLRGQDYICGIPTSGLPFASAVAYELGKPLVYVRRTEIPHGERRRVGGVLKAGSRVLLLDDVVTTGSNLMDAAEAVRGEGGVVEHAVVLLDREEGGSETLLEQGIQLTSVATIGRLANRLHGDGFIDAEVLDEILLQTSKQRVDAKRRSKKNQ